MNNDHLKAAADENICLLPEDNTGSCHQLSVRVCVCVYYCEFMIVIIYDCNPGPLPHRWPYIAWWYWVADTGQGHQP